MQAVTESTILKLVKKLQFPIFRPQLEPIFFFMLYGIQRNNPMILKLVSELPKILEKLRNEGESARQNLEQLEEGVR